VEKNGKKKRPKLVGRDKGSLTEQQTKGTVTTTIQIKGIHNTPGSVWPGWGWVSPPGCAPSWILLKINPVLAKPRTYRYLETKNKRSVMQLSHTPLQI